MRDGFLALAHEFSERFVVIEGTGAVEDVAQKVLSAVEGRL